MIVNQTKGLGFMVKPGDFGQRCSTATVAWADPKSDLICVLLTIKPADSSRANLLGPVSGKVSQLAS